ncbi:MAG: succinate dehydrogenase, hydrophobic membrane anchor protein [Gammaproteobacteria bacterium]|nr:succinate dehydrogenase, hydrophobic membrane anchor protein [Gammaproteobacteria bacterium]
MRQISGLGSWIWQRISALYLALFLMYFISSFILLDRIDYNRWLEWNTHPVNSILLFIGFIMIMLHAWLGIKDVIMDYVHPVVARAVVLMFFALILIVCLVWASQTLMMAMLK